MYITKLVYLSYHALQDVVLQKLLTISAQTYRSLSLLLPPHLPLLPLHSGWLVSIWNSLAALEAQSNNRKCWMSLHFQPLPTAHPPTYPASISTWKTREAPEAQSSNKKCFMCLEFCRPCLLSPLHTPSPSTSLNTACFYLKDSNPCPLHPLPFHTACYNLECLGSSRCTVYQWKVLN